MRGQLFLLTSLLFLTACAGLSPKPDSGTTAASFDPATSAATPKNEDTEEEAPVNDDLIAPGYLIRLHHDEDKDLNGNFRVEFNGQLQLPYNITVQATGLTIDELRKKVLDAYSPFYKSGLHLNVDLAEKAYLVEMRGLVLKPGKYKVHPDTSIDELIAMAGGFPAVVENQPHYMKISRPNHTKVVNLEDYYNTGSIRTTIRWHGGDVLFFQKEASYNDLGFLELGNKVQVLGELRRPGEFPFRAGADVYFYMTEAGGPTRDTDFTKVEIYRGAPGKRKMMRFDLDSPELVPPLMAGDVLMFRSDQQSPFQKTVSTLANLATILSALALLIIAL